MRKTHIVILDAHVANPGYYSWEPLAEFGSYKVWERSEGEAEILSRAAEAEIVLVNKVCLSREILMNLPRLRMVSILATGYNVIDMQTANELGIQVCNVPNYSTSSVAQHVFALLLALKNHTCSYTQAVEQGDWCRSPDFALLREPIEELEGQRMGIVGYGAIGRSVAKIAAAFGMQVLVYSRSKKEQPGLSFVSWPELLAQSDVLSLHCPLSEETAGMINAESLAQMKKGAVLINTARGGLLDEAAVAAALQRGVLSAAALDVLSVEPPRADNPLLHAPNCLVTPHVAWAGMRARRRLLDISFANIRGYLQGNTPNRVN
ncbi:MAG: D-2-hydroxyacid dehydrogenase [Lentisphaeria bacterium]|nr:D-2-hydroxyacid dehydrogenase [Lentisphaeria bacterium]MDY0176215.1 D-2-hydroxyacid dehydrogenase [Lentisphaeria bacterium]